MSGENRQDLLDASSHFAFGKNWASYAEQIGAEEIAEAERGLKRLLSDTPLSGKRFMDIGCGSGLHSLAALRLGAREVLAVDLDSDSVTTTRAVLARHAPGAHYTVQQVSVFELDAEQHGRFDVVYSWGVLHHTGDLARALRQAAAMVAPGGMFIFALYRKTWMCGFWKLEKRWYAHAGPGIQKALRTIHITLFRASLRMNGRRFKEYVRTYKGNRGMDYFHDVHDWLGGYPYESISPDEVALAMARLGLKPVRSFVSRGRILGRYSGILGSGCDEYVYTCPGTSAQAGASCAE